MSCEWNVYSQFNSASRWCIALLSACLLLTACDSGGKIEFRDNSQNSQSLVSQFNLVPGSVAIAVESGKNRSTGYHAKLELNPIKGQSQKSLDGYQLKLKNTRRAQ